MNQTMSVPCVDLIPLFIIEKSRYVLQGFCYCAPHLHAALLFAAPAPTTAAAVLADIRSTAIGCSYLH